MRIFPGLPKFEFPLSNTGVPTWHLTHRRQYTEGFLLNNRSTAEAVVIQWINISVQAQTTTENLAVLKHWLQKRTVHETLRHWN